MSCSTAADHSLRSLARPRPKRPCTGLPAACIAWAGRQLPVTCALTRAGTRSCCDAMSTNASSPLVLVVEDRTRRRHPDDPRTRCLRRRDLDFRTRVLAPLARAFFARIPTGELACSAAGSLSGRQRNTNSEGSHGVVVVGRLPMPGADVRHEPVALLGSAALAVLLRAVRSTCPSCARVDLRRPPCERSSLPRPLALWLRRVAWITLPLYRGTPPRRRSRRVRRTAGRGRCAAVGWRGRRASCDSAPLPRDAHLRHR